MSAHKSLSKFAHMDLPLPSTSLPCEVLGVLRSFLPWENFANVHDAMIYAEKSWADMVYDVAELEEDRKHHRCRRRRRRIRRCGFELFQNGLDVVGLYMKGGINTLQTCLR